MDICCIFNDCFFSQVDQRSLSTLVQIACPWVYHVSYARKYKRCLYQAAARVSANCVRTAVPNEIIEQWPDIMYTKDASIFFAKKSSSV